jgi:membrane-bound serine protease (ClpP class)
MLKQTYHKLIILLIAILFQPVIAGITNRDTQWNSINRKILIYSFSINREIGPAMWRTTQKGFEEAMQHKADLIIIHMNTYGGAVDAADSIRTKILNSPIPVYVFIDNNAASAGALISIAADRIYMRDGANIGAASVVNETGEVLPDKYQSFMRSMMRSTAESHGKDTIINGNDTIYKWRRDPKIAEAMVDPRTFIPGVNDSGKVLSFTTEEAIKNDYCEGKAQKLTEVIELAGIKEYELKEHTLTSLDKVINFLINPVIQGLLIMLIIGGIYFELQTPGIGFPLAAAAAGAVLYFAPLYLEGLAANWEIILFIVGLILIAVEIFAIPGFGVTGITGIALVITGLTLSMIDSVVFELDLGRAIMAIFKALSIVMISITAALLLSLYFTKTVIGNSRIMGLSLKAEQRSSDGYISFDNKTNLIGTYGIAVTMLRPSGKVEIEGDIYDSISEAGYINQGEKVIVLRCETGQLYVEKV